MDTERPKVDEIKMEYNTALGGFINRNKFLKFSLPNIGEVFCFPEGEDYLKRLRAGGVPPPSTETPLNPDGASGLYDPKLLNKYFQTRGYVVAEPLPVINQGGTTLFVCAGVQTLDGVIHSGDDLPNVRLFIAQPVVRTQFLDQIGEGASTSFVNIATEMVNPHPEDHFKALDDWLELLQQLGFRKSEFFFFLTSKERKWGSKKFTSEDFRIRYAGLSVGTAMYLRDIPQESRPNLQISDIGLGLERIRWILNGGKYLHRLVKDRDLSALDPQLVDCCRTLALLAISGLTPSNNDQGYRFRKFSKTLVSRNIVYHQEIHSVIESFYSYWVNWVKKVTPKDRAINEIAKENQRNFNRELINRLGREFSDVGIDINLPTEEVVKLLRGTSAPREVVEKILVELSG